MDVQSGGSWASDEFQVDGLVSHQDNTGHRCHFYATGVRPHLKCLDHLWGEGVGSASGTPWDAHPSSWQDILSEGIPTYPGKGQVHLQLSDAAPDARADPVAEGDGAEGVVRGAVSPEPALGQEPLGLGEVGLIMGHRVVRQDKEGLQGGTGV